jgi:hypothetical protein
MAGSITYDRDKDPKINATVIDIVAKAGEDPAAPAALVGGSTGFLDLEFEVDADESGGVALVNVFRVDGLKVLLDPATGLITLAGTIVPVLGDGTDAPTTYSILQSHPQTMEAWQTAAGRAQQV